MAVIEMCFQVHEMMAGITMIELTNDWQDQVDGKHYHDVHEAFLVYE